MDNKTVSVIKDIFIEQALQRKLDRDGIVCFKLPKAQLVDDCAHVLESLAPPVPEAMKKVFYSGVMDNDVEQKHKISNALRDVIEPVFKSMIKGYTFISFSYMVKGAGEKSMLDIHQDWTITDEQKGWSYILWIPLIDSTIANGTMYALRGSHRFPDNIRGGGIFPKYMANRELAMKHMVPYTVKRGEAVIFNSRLIHFSPNNTTDKGRMTAAGTLAPIGLPIKLHNGSLVDGNLKVKAYNVPADFYLNYTNFMAQKDEAPDFAQFDYDVPRPNTDALSDAEFQKLLNTLPKRPWYARLLGK
ncbi:MAG: hypothetical protein Salg2KO_03640 [Salibacteraceae bacterium]